MAEIPVERKSNKKWLWILLALILLVLLIWWIADDDEEVDYAADTVATEEVGDAVGAPMAVGPEGQADGTQGAMTIASILANPDQYVGRDDFQGEVGVPEVPSDRGFWVEQDGRRMFAIIIDEPREVPKDINSGQQLRITEGMVRAPDNLADIAGVPLTARTRQIAQEQQAFLLVDEQNIEIMSGAQ